MLQNKKKPSANKKKVRSMGKAICLGIIEGGLSAGIIFVLLKIHTYAIFAVLGFWLLFGWILSYIITINTLEILTTILSSTITSVIIYYFMRIYFWFIILIIGLSILFWSISFVTKILLFPPSYLKKETELI